MSLKTYDASKSAFIERDKVKIYKDGAWSLIDSAKAYKGESWEEFFYSGIPLSYVGGYGTGIDYTPDSVTIINDIPGKFLSLGIDFSGWKTPTISLDWEVYGAGTIAGFNLVSPKLYGYNGSDLVYENGNIFARTTAWSGHNELTISNRVTRLVFSFSSCNKSYSDLETIVYGLKNLVIQGEKYKLK